MNEGMSTQASTAVKQMLGQAMKMAGGLSNQALTMISTQTDMSPVTTAQALLTPFEVQEEVVHPVGINHASGNAPGMLVQILWIGCLIISVFMFQAPQKAVADGAAGEPRLWRAGLPLAGLASGFLVWMASSWYGMEFTNGAAFG